MVVSDAFRVNHKLNSKRKKIHTFSSFCLTTRKQIFNQKLYLKVPFPLIFITKTQSHFLYFIALTGQLEILINLCFSYQKRSPMTEVLTNVLKFEAVHSSPYKQSKQDKTRRELKKNIYSDLLCCLHIYCYRRKKSSQK